MPPPPVCACVWVDDPAATRARLAALAGRAARVELRLDRVGPDFPLEALFPTPLPALVTCRPAREGGAWEGSEEARLRLLQRAVDAGADWVDLEADVPADAVRGAKVLRSRHVLEPSAPASWPELLDGLRGGDGSKLAVKLEDAEAALALLALAEAREPRPLVVGLGPAGSVTRILGPSHGLPWSYAADDPQAPTGPGQLGLEQLAGLWQGERARATAFYGVVGRPVGHSRSPALFNRAFAALGEPALYTWLETADPRALWDRCAADPRWRGFSVTVPHKQAAAAWAAEVGVLSPAARATGAVNTLTRMPEGWRAENTDALALLELLEPHALPGREARVLGSGGAARAAVWALRQLGAQVFVHARDPGRGKRLAAELGAIWGGDFALVGTPAEQPRVLIQATTVGMRGGPDPEGALLPELAFDERTLVYELVYTPRETPFVRRARARGAEVIDGAAHFGVQARAQLTAWLGARPLSDADWAACLAEALAE
ncbi:MAG: type I 3-dehydroquinate dehydratase [Planctomycetota bacterium]